MDHRVPQVPMPGSHRPSVPANSLPPEYWSTLDALYSGPDPQQQPQQHQQQQPIPRQQQPESAQQPLGIDWSHPVFQQQHPPQQTQLPRQQEPNHGIYSSPTPQSWQQNPLQQNPLQQNPLQQPLMSSTPQPLGIPSNGLPSNYGQVHQFPQTQLGFDPEAEIPLDTGDFDPVAFSQDFFASQQLATPDTFAQQPQHHAANTPPVPAVPYQSRSQQAPIPQYSIPTAFPEGTPHNFTNGNPGPIPNHHTINPQFLNPPQQASNQQQASLDNSFLYLNPTDLDPSGGQKTFNYFHNDLHMPQLNQPVMRDQPIPGRDMIVGGQGPAMVQARSVRQPTQMPSRTTGVPKQAKIQPKKPAQGTVEVSSDSESDSDSDVEIEAPSPEEPSPIPPNRPTEPLAAARYDTLQAVWSPRNRRPNADKVKNALVAFKDVVKAVRDTWKENSQAMKTAENQGDSGKAAKLKDLVVLQRRIMDVVVSTTLEMGHPMIVEKLGEHPMSVTAMYSFLLDRHQAADFDGELTVKILRLLSNFITVDEDTLQKTNVAKVLPRFSKKGGQVVKDLTKKIQDNAASSTKRKQDSSKSSSKEGSPSKGSASDSAGANGSRSEAPAGTKRPREGESNGQPATKRAVVTSNVKNPSKPSSTANGTTAKRPQEGAQEAKGAAAAAARPKANIVAPKPTNLFGSLSSASKRPGTSNAERAAAAAARTPSASEKRKEAPPPKPAFSFGDIMADLNKQKEPEPAKPVEEGPPETEEEREKRLRKEARRRLRVTWKPESSLEEVRYFTHDPEEELGPGDRPQREAGDVKGEGRILKLHKDVDELGEEDEGSVREVNLLEYRVPSEITFDLPSEDRSRNFIKHGGTQEPTSTEKKAQEHREATTLMVFYTSLADVPPSPKEPAPPSDDEIVPDEQAFGELPDHVKARQERYYAFINPQPAAPPAQSTPAPGQFDISNLLKIIQSASSQQQAQTQAPSFPPPQPATPAPSSDIERTINMFRQQQQQQQQQPQVPPAIPQMPQFPLPQPQAAQGVDFQKLLSVINSQKQVPQVQQPPVIPPTPQSQPGIAPNLAAIISQLNGQTLQAGQNQASSQTYEDPERKRMRDIGGTDSSSDERSKRTRPNLPNKKHPKVGIVPCRYWREGKCLKGDECTFRHDPLP